MKLKEYLDNLNKLVKENPDCLEYEVVSSIDDEGNGFNSVYYSPTLGIFEDDEFISGENIDERGRSVNEINAICIN